MEIMILAALLYAFFMVFFLVFFFIGISKNDQQTKSKFSTAVLLFSEIIYTIIGPIIGFARFDMYGPEIPFAKNHVLIIILLVIVASASFWVARLYSKTENPILRIIVSAGMLQGILLCAITTIHFLEFIPLGMMYPFMGFELLSPLFALLILSREFYVYNKKEFDLEDALPYRQEFGMIPIPLKILQTPFLQRIVIYLILLLPFVFLQMLLTFGCGQELDAILKAFTDSVGFVFSHKFPIHD
ncbi:MAG: hypothetical protein IPP64_08505 [Bacteroidetes bacterium]|nr:hypothetical protein [Bacteroidota bacterium]